MLMERAVWFRELSGDCGIVDSTYPEIRFQRSYVVDRIPDARFSPASGQVSEKAVLFWRGDWYHSRHHHHHPGGRAEEMRDVLLFTSFQFIYLVLLQIARMSRKTDVPCPIFRFDGGSQSQSFFPIYNCIIN